MELPVLRSAPRGQRKPSKSSAESAVSAFPVSSPSLTLPSSARLPVASSLMSPSSTAPSFGTASSTTSKFSSFFPCSTSALPSLLPYPPSGSSSSLCTPVPSSILTPRSRTPLSAASFNEVFSSFPAAILFQLASFLYPVDVNNLLSTCTCWHSLCTLGLQPLWREFVNRTFGRKYENYVAFTGDNDWRSLYIKIARFISNLKRGKAEQRRFPRLLLPPVSNTYEGSLAMTTDCTRLLWENGRVLQCLDVDVGKELWRVDLAECRNKGWSNRNCKTNNRVSDSDFSAPNPTRSTRNSTGRSTCYTRASSVVIGRSKVFLHLEHQVYVYRLSDGTFVTTLCAPLEEGEGAAAFVGNNMPLDVSLRNDHFTFLTKTALFVFHSESLQLLYKIQHRELTPAMDTCEDIDFCWAGNRCCGSVKCFDYAAERAFLESPSSEGTRISGEVDVPSGAARSTDANKRVVCGNHPDTVHRLAAECSCRPNAAATPTAGLCEASTSSRIVDPFYDKGKRPCAEGFPFQWGCEFSCAEHRDNTTSDSPSSTNYWFSPTCCTSVVDPVAERTLPCQVPLNYANCFDNDTGKTTLFSKSSLLDNPLRALRRSCQFIPAADKFCSECTSDVTGVGFSDPSGRSPHEGHQPPNSAKNRQCSEVCAHRCRTGKSTADYAGYNRALRGGQVCTHITTLTPTGNSRSSTQTQLGSQYCSQYLPFDEMNSMSPLPLPRSQTSRSAEERVSPSHGFAPDKYTVYTTSSPRRNRRCHGFPDAETKTPLSLMSKTTLFSCRLGACKTPSCCDRVRNQCHRGSECFECGANKLSFRSRCQQSCRHIVTWLVKRSKTIKFWDIRDGASICTLHAHDAPIQKVRHVMNWKEITEYFLASLDIAGVVKIWGSCARGFWCLQELRPEQNNCVFRMSFSPTHLATMSKESAGSEVVVTVWKFDQEKAASAMQRLQRQRSESQRNSNRVMSSETSRSSSSKTGDSCMRSSSRNTNKRKDERVPGDAQQLYTRLKFCEAEHLNKTTQKYDTVYRSDDPLNRDVSVENYTPENRDIKNSVVVCQSVEASVITFEYGKEGISSQHINTPRAEALHPSANRRVYRSIVGCDSERRPLRRAFSRLTGPSLLHPSCQYSCNQVAVDPEDPSPHVKQAYLLDTRSTATLGERANTTSSPESIERTRITPEHIVRKSDWSSGNTRGTTEVGSPLVRNLSLSHVGADRKSHDTLPPCDVALCTGSVADASEKAPRQRGEDGCRHCTTTKKKSNSRTKPSDEVSPPAALSRFSPPESVPGVHDAGAALSKNEKIRDVRQFSRLSSRKLSTIDTETISEQRSGPARPTTRRLPEEARVVSPQIPSPGGSEPVENFENSAPKDEIVAVLEKEGSFSAGVTAYYADFIDGQLLALWHFTVSPANREHSAFQYSLSDWKIYDCLHKTKNRRATVRNKDERQKCVPPTEQLWPSRQPAAAGHASESPVNAHTADSGPADTAYHREEHSVAGERTQEAFTAPVFSMSNRGDVWTLLDWKCLSFEPHGDVTVLDFCPTPSQKLHVKQRNT